MPDFSTQRAEEVAVAIAAVISEYVLTYPVYDERHQDQANEKQTHKYGEFLEGEFLACALVQGDRSYDAGSAGALNYALRLGRSS